MLYKTTLRLFHLVLIGLFTLTASPGVNGYDLGGYYFQQDTVEVENLLVQSQEAQNNGEFNKANELLDEAESIYLDDQNTEGLAKVVAYRVDLLIDQLKYDEAMELVDDALEEYPNSSQMAQYHNLKAIIYSRTEDLVKSAEHFNLAKQFLDRLPEDEIDQMNARLYHNLGNVYGNMGQKELAFENYQEAVEYATSVQDSALLILAYNNLGMEYDKSEDYEKALYYLERSLDLAKQQGLTVDIFRAHLNLGNTLSNTENFEEALSNYNEAEDALSVLQPGVPSPIIMHNRGRTLARMERYDEAEELLFSSLELCEDQGITDGIYYNNFVIGKMYAEQERYEEAVEYLTYAASIADDAINSVYRLEVAKALHEVYARDNRYREAYDQLLKYSTIADSVNKEERSEALANAQNYLELERQNEINSLLQEKQTRQEEQLRNRSILILITVLVIILVSFLLYQMKKTSREKEKMYSQLKEQNKELEELNKAKDKLFAIISHDLRSPLMSMQGMLSLIKSDLLTLEEIQELIPELEASMQENSNVVEDLLVWAKEQLSGVEVSLKPVAVSDLLEDVIHSQKFIADKKKVDLTADVMNGYDVKADYNALSLVIRNLISNAIKFTEPGDTIRVSSEESSDHVIIKVKDTGIGIPEDARDKIFENTNWTRKGTQNEKGSGLGLSLSKDFVERMHGKISFESEVGEGTTFMVEIPKA
ncbi:ATP-binding protein [Gracilimonas amylolytica]|uniref:ATP-binding protein n=1 Tax=Gracilimonas amylolytica TaxID=1749045 RepID=UPI000CD955EC|nr:ATP-binding protein [Gracilimonas amylolytica]